MASLESLKFVQKWVCENGKSTHFFSRLYVVIGKANIKLA